VVLNKAADRISLLSPLDMNLPKTHQTSSAFRVLAIFQFNQNFKVPVNHVKSDSQNVSSVQGGQQFPPYCVIIFIFSWYASHLFWEDNV